jgi:hypothetical protein
MRLARCAVLLGVVVLIVIVRGKRGSFIRLQRAKGGSVDKNSQDDYF